jgi:hypothetical protein
MTKKKRMDEKFMKVWNEYEDMKQTLDKMPFVATTLELFEYFKHHVSKKHANAIHEIRKDLKRADPYN